MKIKILQATTIAKLQTAINNELQTNKATGIISASISVYNGLYYCILAYRSAAS